MCTRETSLVIGLSLLLTISCFAQVSKLADPPQSYLNGTWKISSQPPSFYFVVPYTWGKAKDLGESSLAIDLGEKATGGKGYFFLPGGGGWRILSISPLDKTTVKLEIESLDTGPKGHMNLALTMHFLSPNKFWLESGKPLGINTGPKLPWYRLSGPGDPTPPPPPPGKDEE